MAAPAHSWAQRRAHSRRRAAVGALLVVGATLTGCVGKVDRGWIFEDAAVLRCSVSGRNHQLHPAWLDLPVPMPPTNFFARAMDPVALDNLGFERDARVCAVLDAPSAEEIEAAQSGLPALVDARNEADMALRKLPACGCFEARRAGVDGFFRSCQNRRSRLARTTDCKADEALEGQVVALVEPVREALEATAVPKRHWRMFGRADRPDRFVTRFSDIVGMYEGGSEIFVPGQTPSGGRSDELVAALLEQPHVLAVVRQDAGMRVLVVRSMGRQLVFDLFEHDTSSSSSLLGEMASALDAAHVDMHVRALERPQSGTDLAFSPKRGPLLMVDRAGLTRVDEAVIAASTLADRPYKTSREHRVSPPDLVDRLEFQLDPSGEIRGRAHLSGAGVAAVEGIGQTQLSVQFDQLPFDREPPAFTPAADLALVLRGQPVEHGLFDGFHGLFRVLEAVERSNPGALEGNIDQFAVTLPAGPLPGKLRTRPGLEHLRERLSKRAQRLEAKRVGDVYEFTLTPQ